MSYGDLPEPKFRVGQTVWYAETERKEESFPCPDCLGSKVWKVETPAGQTYEAKCQRCQGGYYHSHWDEIAPLNYTVIVASPRSRVIKELEVRTRGHFGEGPEIRYDGYSEGALFATEEEARAASEAVADAENLKIRRTPQFLEQKNIGVLVFKDGRWDQFKNGLWNAWYAYRSMCEKIAEHLEGKETLNEEDVSYLKSDVQWEMEYRTKGDRPLDALVEAVAAAMGGDPTKLAPAYEALPSALKHP